MKNKIRDKKTCNGYEKGGKEESFDSLRTSLFSMETTVDKRVEWEESLFLPSTILGRREGETNGRTLLRKVRERGKRDETGR